MYEGKRRLAVFDISVLNEYQTGYEEDSFVADKAEIDPAFRTKLLNFSAMLKDDIELVNIAGILAKIADSFCFQTAIKLISKRKSIGAVPDN